MLPSISHVLLSLILCVLLRDPILAIKQSYIVYLGSHSFGPNPSAIDVEFVTDSHYNLLGSFLGSTEKAKEAIFYSYNRYINGFAAVLEEDEAANVAQHPNVVSVLLNKKRKLDSTHSWDFLGLERNDEFPEASVWRKTMGEDIIIGNIDTGVWPESKSFSDEGFGPIPKRWRGICQTEDKVRCNRKLIGTRYFAKGLEASIGIKLTGSMLSARDYEGHGSHTLSTAGGNFVHGASVFGNGNGTASGGSPKARVAAYKACWPQEVFGGGCFDADILAALEAAISDGVDVISMSLGSDSPQEFYQSAVSIGSFHAVANGITVVASAGNAGPSPGTIENNEPWILTVAASTIDRNFASYVALGDKKVFKGSSLSEHGLPSNKMYPLISAFDASANKEVAMAAPFCLNGTLDAKKVKGKILVCLRGGDIGRIAKGEVAASVGAVGMILANDKDSGNEIISDPHVLPTSQVDFTSGTYIYNYINHTKSPVAHISRVETQLGVKPDPVVASFSSRGPNQLEAAILKPDVTAPGVNIIAAYSEAVSPTELDSDTRRTPFITMSGTSMSCPHVAGLAGLIKALHPDWSPAAIMSAIITTATTQDNSRKPIQDASLNKATPFAYGSGHIRPNRAVNPGLVYDQNITDHLNFLCARGYNSSLLRLFYGKPYTCPKSFNLADYNYPAITIPRFGPGHSVSVTRTVTNVGSPKTYRAHIKAPPQVLVSVEPRELKFKTKGEKKEFRVTLTLKPQNVNTSDYVFGWLTWSDGNHQRVRSPISVNLAH